MSSLVDQTIYSLDANITSLLSGDNLVPEVTKGNTISTKSWEQESLLRLLINKTELDVSQYFGKLPSYQYEDLVDWMSLRLKVKSILELKNDETLIIENNKVIDTIKTAPNLPRAINLTSDYRYFEDFDTSMYPIYEKMLKESSLYSDSGEFISENQIIFKNIADTNFNESLDGKLAITSGFGNQGVAQTQGIFQNGGVVVVSDLNQKLLEKRLDNGFCSRLFYDNETALDYAIDMKRSGIPKIIAVASNADMFLKEVVNRGYKPNIVTDATPAFDSLNGYLPTGYSFNDLFRIRKVDPEYYINIANHSMMNHVKCMIDLQKRGSLVFEFGDSLRTKAYKKGFENAFAINSDEINKYVKTALINNEQVVLKWFALSNEQEDIFIIDDIIVKDFIDKNPALSRLIDTVNRISFNKNLPTRKVIVDKETAIDLCHKINESIKFGEISCPVLISTSKFNNYADDFKFFKEGFLNLHSVIQNIDHFTNTSWVNLSYLGNSDSYHKLE